MKQLILVFCLALLWTAPVTAHHNWSAIYDVNDDIEIEGVVSRVIWRNPHVVMYFTVDAGTPNEKEYSTASNSVASLARMNVSEDLVAVGTKIRAAGYPSRTKPTDFFMNNLLLEEEGREIVFLRTADPRWPEVSERIGDANFIHGLNEQEDISERPTSMFAAWTTLFGVEGSHRALRGPGPEFQINYAEPRGSGDCTSKDVWTQMGAPYPMQLVDNEDGTIIIHQEENDTIRPVVMNVEHNDPGTVKNNIGYSTGRFDDDVLKVTTSFEGSDSPIQMLETFQLSEDRNRLNYTQQLVDTETGTESELQTKWWEFQLNTVIQPYDCVVTE